MNDEENELNQFMEGLKTCPQCKAVVNGERYCHNCGREISNHTSVENSQNLNNIIKDHKSETQNYIPERNTSKKNTNSKKTICITAIIGIIIAIFIGYLIYDDAQVKKHNDNTLLVEDFRYALKQIDNGMQYLNDGFEILEDGYGRTLINFSYNRRDAGSKTGGYNVHQIVMFMKKDGIVHYVEYPVNKYENPYASIEDFKNKNNWGKSTNIGLEKGAISFTSPVD